MLNTVLPFLDCSKDNSERKCVEDGTLLREEEVRVNYQLKDQKPVCKGKDYQP